MDTRGGDGFSSTVVTVDAKDSTEPADFAMMGSPIARGWEARLREGARDAHRAEQWCSQWRSTVFAIARLLTPCEVGETEAIAWGSSTENAPSSKVER